MRIAHSIAAFVLLLSASAAYAVTEPQWTDMPPACTPERAVPWVEGVSEEAQAPCHCPPTSMCPQTYEEYSNPNTAKMPMRLISKCCPVIEPDQCPAGTALAGQKIPADNNCNPTCPAGTPLAGQKMPDDGICNPAAQCPDKYYPSFERAGITTDGGQYNYGNGSQYSFDYGARNTLAPHIGILRSDTRVASISRYNFSISKMDTGWSFYDDNCRFYGKCPMSDFYNDVLQLPTYSRLALVHAIETNGRDKLAWFGYGYAPIDKLKDNLMKPAMLKAWAGRDVLQIADYEIGMTGYWNNKQEFDIDTSIKNGALDFFQQCRAAAGEYVELDEIHVEGNRCQYLQCRYVREVTSESCMTGDTKITLADGSVKALKDVGIGERVKGKDGVHKVTALNNYQSRLRVLYGINGSGPMITGDHPIRTTEGFKLITDEAAALSAGKPGFAKTKLAVGDTLVTDKGEVKVTDIKRFPSIEPVATYNIKVDGNASFFANGLDVRGFDKMEMKY